ncbi:hypothetical protein [Turneriella parva]|uniref:Uncharacterized protein n=1 Tax=Turneriella parva (strain ATCC BAA-1111 / DSM 21527 / NCTC 11395 / H) TaxID=869212 RepID=I4B7P8_TURPD|nr:hypothetical protein [Turneriella parva]AFM13305.1 hypothetical protein Turpa_2665 [Turneriella parva DSM 21527]
MVRENIFIVAGENSALDELYPALKHMHGLHVDIQELRNVLSGLYHRQELCKIFSQHTVVTNRSLSIEWVADEAAYLVTDRLRILAPLHLRILMHLRQEAEGTQTIFSKKLIKHILRETMEFASTEVEDVYDQSDAELVYIYCQLHHLLDRRLDLDTNSIAEVSALIEEAHFAYILENF